MNRLVFALRLVAGSLAVLALVAWLATGTSRGWTKTSVAVNRVDEVTGLTYPDYQRRLVLGLDALGGGLIGAIAVFAASCVLARLRPATPGSAA